MRRIALTILLVLAAPSAYAAACGATANRAGCVGPNGAAGYNKNTGAVHTTNSAPYNRVAPGTHVEGRYGNSATKGVAPGCGYVNGRRVCG
jgi:hypothetical protein